jgi:hypothetical protein
MPQPHASAAFHVQGIKGPLFAICAQHLEALTADDEDNTDE